MNSNNTALAVLGVLGALVIGAGISAVALTLGGGDEPAAVAEAPVTTPRTEPEVTEPEVTEPERTTTEPERTELSPQAQDRQFAVAFSVHADGLGRIGDLDTDAADDITSGDFTAAATKTEQAADILSGMADDARTTPGSDSDYGRDTIAMLEGCVEAHEAAADALWDVDVDTLVDDVVPMMRTCSSEMTAIGDRAVSMAD